MPSKFTESDKKIYWTRHSREKMRQYQLSESRIKRVLRNPERKEVGIAPGTTAMMQSTGTKKSPKEIWVMYQLVKSKVKSSRRSRGSSMAKPSGQKSKLKGVMHGFVGTLEQLKEYLKMGFYIGFNGIIFKEIEGINFKENIRKTPLERILIETDCPYLIPPLARPNFAVKRNEGGPEQIDRNEPIFVKYIAQEIAKIKNLDYQKVAEITTQNAKKLFNL